MRELGHAQLVARVHLQEVGSSTQLGGHLLRQPAREATLQVDRGQLLLLALGVTAELSLLDRQVGPLASACELTETYSPAAIEAAPATSPAVPAVRIAARVESAEATPTMIAAVETMPSLAPSTAARSHPVRWSDGVRDDAR